MLDSGSLVAISSSQTRPGPHTVLGAAAAVVGRAATWLAV